MFDHCFDNGGVFSYGKGGGFSRSADGDDAVGAVGNVPVNQCFELLEIDAAVFVHGGNQCNQAACQHNKTFVVGWKKHADFSLTFAG